ncbi:YajG family lipoprotein [Campylobacterota bacterium]
MKNVFYLLIAALIMGGCTYNNEALTLDVYKGEYSGKNVQNNKTVYLRSVKDMRTDKKNIGYTLINEQKDQTLYSDIDFVNKYTTGLRYALDIAGFEIVSNKTDANKILDISIQEIEIVYNNKIFGTNLRGLLAIEVLVEKDQKVTTLNFKPQASQWISPSYTSKDLEPFLHTLFSDSINNITSRLTEY